MDPHICVEKTIFYTNEERMAPFTLMSDFKRLDYIPCHGHGYVLGVVKEPLFKTSTVRLTCNISFNFDKHRSEQLHVGTIEVSHKDIIKCSYAAFNHDKGVPDLLSIFATSLQCDIKVMEFNEEIMSNLIKILSTLKLIKINEKYYLTDYKKSISFRGLLLQIINKDSSCIICFYSRNLQDLCLYIQSFKQLPLDFMSVMNANVMVNTIFSSLFHEIKNFKVHIKSKLSENNTKIYSSGATIIQMDTTKINDLISLEENTEYYYSMLKQYTEK